MNLTLALPLVGLALLANASLALHGATESGLRMEALPEGLRGILRPSGVRIEVDDRGRSFAVEVRTRAIARGATVHELAAVPTQGDSVRAQRDLGGVSEWYEARADGLEHGWTLASAPEGDAHEPVWILLEFRGDLSPKVLEGGSSTWLVDSQAQLRMRYEGLRAWDADRNPVDVRFGNSPLGFGVRVDDRGARYPITVDPIFTQGPVIFEAPNAGSFGTRAATAGDVNGDGYSDILITAGTENANEGRAYVYYGAAGGVSTIPSWSYAPGQTGARFGTGGTAGDVNGDGYDDVILGAWEYDDPVGGGREGRVWLFLGSSSGLSASPVWTYSTGEAGSEFGTVCQTAGDVNGDGLDDVIIGAQSHSSPGLTLNGEAFVFLGHAISGLAATPVWNQAGADNNYEFGAAGCGAGDLDADGYDDIVVGARNALGQGRVFVYRGSATGPVTSSITLTPSQIGSTYKFGSQVAPAGDVNGDGYADIVVGANQADVGFTNSGQAYIFLGRPAGSGTIYTTDHWTQNGPYVSAAFGDGVGPAGDLNGDGFADVAIGSQSYNAVPDQPGKVYVLLGPSLTAPTAHQLVFTGTGHDACGQRLYTAGDVNGDGFGDLLIGAPLHGSTGRAYLLYGEPKPASTAYVSTFSGAGTGAAAGSAVALGDVDADGFADAFVGEPNYANPTAGEGLVRFYRGRPGGVTSAPSWTREGNEAGLRFGASIAFLGDVDGDGLGDVFIGAPGASNGQASEGRVYLFRGVAGNPGGPGSGAQTFESNVVEAQLGFSVAAAGDVNGDGLADAIAGAPKTLGSPGNGALYLFLGQRSPPGLAPQPVIYPAPAIPGAWFGHSVAGAGDLNGDGYSDVVVGAPRFTNGQSNEGAIYVYRGSPAGLVTTPDTILEGNEDSAEFGFAVAAAGDVTEDLAGSFADLLVGAPGWAAGTKGGFAFLYRGQAGGSILNPTPLHSIHFGQADARTGAALAAAGDLNGDGRPDVVIGAPYWNGTATNNGRAAVFFGTGGVLAGASTQPPSSAGISTPGEEHTPGNNDLGGSALAAAADLNGDGFGDLLVGAPGGGTGGEAFVYAGGYGVTATRTTAQQRRHDDLTALDLLGRSEASGSFGMSTSLVVHYPPDGPTVTRAGTVAGRERFRVVWEAKPLGTQFDGSGLGVFQPAYDSGIPTPQAMLANERFAVTGLVANTNYHWRIRHELRNPYFPRSRWYYLQGNSRQEKKVGTAKDCDGDGISDELEFLGGTALDCNGNAIPDNCDIAVFQTSLDCNSNGSPDECDLVLNDCNGNLVPDECDISSGTSQDCDPYGPVGPNGVPDECDIASGTMLDTNGDGVPDDCQSTVTLFCFGDGSGTGCPCANNSPVGNQDGCRNSLGTDGRLRAGGVAAVAADTFVLLGSQMPNSSALYFQGTSQQNGGLGNVFGDGLRCASGSVLRLGTKTNTGNASQYPVPGDLPISVRGAIPPGGGTRHYQCWYRNAAAFCTASTFNLTNGLTATWVP